MSPKLATDFETLSFKTAADYRKWLAKNHADTDGLWLRIFKKGSGVKSVTYAEALDEALCYGWIDGLKRSYDDHSWIQKFTPRKSNSKWSRLNTQHAERLIREGRMQPTGLKVIQAAKDDGRWAAAYDSPSASTPPEDFLRELKKSKKAWAFFETLNKTNRYAICYRLQTAKKPETRAKRMKDILAMLGRGDKFH